MAKHNNYNSIEFYYIDENPLDKLCLELQNKFKYQKIMFVGFNENEKNSLTQKLKHEFFLCFSDEICNEDFTNDICCIVCSDNKKWDSVKYYCNLYEICCILYIKNYQPLINWHSDDWNNNFILGCILDKTALINNNFESLFTIDISYIYFLSLEIYFNNIFFNNNKQTFDIKLLHEVNQLVVNIDNINSNDILFDIYYKCTMQLISHKKTVIHSILLNEKNIFNLCFKQQLVVNILFNIYKLFLLKITKNLQNFPLFLQKNVKKPQKVSKIIDFSQKLDEQKFWFMKQNFEDKYIGFIEDYLEKTNLLKQNFYYVNSNKIYNKIKKINLSNLKNQIVIGVENFNENSFSKIIEYFGYFNLSD